MIENAVGFICPSVNTQLETAMNDKCSAKTVGIPNFFPTIFYYRMIFCESKLITISLKA